MDTRGLPEVVTVKALAERLGCSARLIHQRIYKGDLPAPLPNLPVTAWRRETLYEYVDNNKYTGQGKRVRAVYGKED